MRCVCRWFVALWALAVTVSGCLVTGGSDETREDRPRPCRCEARPPVAAFNRSAPPQNGGALNIRIPREPASLLPHVDGDPLVRNIINGTVLESLVRIAPDGKNIVPELAERFEVDEAHAKYIFYLREDALWHDGRPVSASDVSFIFSKLLDPYSASAVNTLFSNIKSISTPDEGTVIFTLDHFLPGFLIAVASIPILPAHVFGRTPLALHEAARAPIGSGPFRFVRWVPSRLIELERNPYWRGTPPHIDQLVYHIVPDNRIALDMLNHGDLDIVPNLPASAEYTERRGHHLIYPLPFVEAWVYNFENPIFSDARSRRALAMLIDKREIRCSILRCRADLPDEIGGDMILPTLPFDPNAARKRLKEAGWADRDGDGRLDRNGIPFSFSLLIPNLGRDLERSAIAVQADLADVGIEMRISTVSRGAFYGRLAVSRFDVALLAVPAGARFDPWSLFHTPRGPTGNFGAFSSSRVDALLEKLQTESAPFVRELLIDDLRQGLTRHQPMTFTFRAYASAMVRSYVGGVVFENGWFDESAVFVMEKPR